MKLSRNFWIVLALFLVVLLSYANAFRNEFAWDDEFFIVNNMHIQNFDEIPGFFAEPSTGDLYRPLRSVFYSIIYKIWQLNAFGYHLNGFLLHFFITAILFFITLKITDNALLSFVASLFFAAHPIHTARVTNMTASFDLYGILFLLLSLLFYILYSKYGSNRHSSSHYYWPSIIFYLLALFSSEEALTLILILALYDFSFNHEINTKNLKAALRKYVPYIAVTVIYLAIRFFVLQKIGRAETYFMGNFYGTFLTTVKIFANYVLIMFFPAGIATERYVKFETSALSINLLISLLALILILFFFWKSYNQSKILFFSIGWFFITLLPFSNIAPQYTIMADRYLYLPSYGFVLFLALLTFQIKKIESIKKYSNMIVVLLVLLIASIYSVLTIQNNAEWRDSFTLLTSSLEKNPLGTKTHNELALYYRDKLQDYDTALKLAFRAIELGSENHNAYENIGTIYAKLGDYDKAILNYKKSIELNPRYYRAHNNLGLIYSYTGNFNASVYYLKQAVSVEPKLAKAHNDLGTVYAKIGEFELAIEEMERSIKINPYEPDYYYNLAVMYKFLKENEKAKGLLKKALEIEPNNEKVKKRLADIG